MGFFVVCGEWSAAVDVDAAVLAALRNRMGIGEPAASAFDVLDGGVVRLDLRGGGAGDDEDLDCLPPAADRAPQPGRFRLAGAFTVPGPGPCPCPDQQSWSSTAPTFSTPWLPGHGRTARTGNGCSSMPSIRGASLSTSGSVSAAECRALWTSPQETANAAAVLEAARLQTTLAGLPTGMSRIRWRRRE
ncbi:MAG: hypothetical protein JWN05_2230 [Arthrobacter sp.]|nr:hypothetical protein [Arthrobacter sp.]